MDKKNCIESLLRSGAENVTPTAELLTLSGIESVRKLQMQIATEREAGALILSSTNGGYFLPSRDPERRQQEIQSYIHTLRNRALSTLKILRSANRAVKVSGKQFSMFDDN